MIGPCVGIGGGGLSFDIGSLVGALGGNASVPAIYDVRTGVTVVSGAVSQVTDARGSGFGPSLAQATASKRPLWDASALTMTFDGATHFLTTATSALFDLSGAYSVVFVGAITAGAGTAYAAVIDDGTFVRALGVQRTTAIRAIVVSGASFVEPSSGVLTGASRRLAVASKTATTGCSVDVPSQARVSLVNAANVAAGNNLLSVGAVGAGTFAAACVARAVLVLTRQVTAGDLTTLLAWAQTNHGAVTA